MVEKLVTEFKNKLIDFILDFCENNSDFHLLQIDLNTERLIVIYYDEKIWETKTMTFTPLKKSWVK